MEKTVWTDAHLDPRRNDVAIHYERFSLIRGYREILLAP